LARVLQTHSIVRDHKRNKNLIINITNGVIPLHHQTTVAVRAEKEAKRYQQKQRFTQ